MPTKRHKIVLPSSMTMRFGMLLAFFAWIMHIVPLLTPLWDENATLGHGVCIQLAPIVAVAQHHEQIAADITHSQDSLANAAADHHLHHHKAPNSLAADSRVNSSVATNSIIPATLAPPATVQPIIVVDAKSSSEVAHSGHDVGDTEPDTLQHISCDLCLSMSAVMLPDSFAPPEADWIELSAALVLFLPYTNSYYSSKFLRPLVRAPPTPILT